jgi:hypothetical protein
MEWTDMRESFYAVSAQPVATCAGAVLPSRLAAIKIPSGGKESIRGARERSQTTFCQDDPLTLSSNAILVLHSQFMRQDRLRRLLPSGRDVVSSPPCTLQYSFSASPLSASRLRVRNQKTSFNEAMHNANDTKTTIASASNSPVREPKA